MKRRLAILLALGLLCGLPALAESAAAENGEESSGKGAVWDLPDAPELAVPEIKVPKVPEPKTTRTPKIEVPQIPAVELPGAGTLWTPDSDSAALDAGTAEAAPAGVEGAEEVLEALGVDAYRRTYEALLTGGPVKNGAWGDAARGVQQTLAALGQNVKVDGIFGPRTLAALKAAQSALGLEVTDTLDAAGYIGLLSGLLAQ